MQVAAEVRRSWSDHPERIDVKDMLLSFKTNTHPETKELTEDQKQMKLATSKAFWAGIQSMPQDASNASKAKKEGPAHEHRKPRGPDRPGLR